MDTQRPLFVDLENDRSTNGRNLKSATVKSFGRLKFGYNVLLGVEKLTRSGLNGVLERDFAKTNLPFLRLIKVLHLRGGIRDEKLGA